MSERRPGRPKKTDYPKCKVTDCQSTTERGSHGLCHKHYVAARRGAIDLVSGERTREPLRVSSYGPGARCSVTDCDRRPKANGLCHAHWQRVNNGVDLESPIGAPRGQSATMVQCCVSGCDQRANNRGMCQSHAAQRARGILNEQGVQIRELSKGGRPKLKDRWVGKDGYVLVQAPQGHPFARVDGSILEHRLVMEQHLGCYLDPDEFLVHHKFGNRSDNVPEKLEVLSARASTGEGHPPGSEVPPHVLTQMLLQREDLPDGLRQWLLYYQQVLRGNVVN